jgi:hypothetical protein
VRRPHARRAREAEIGLLSGGELLLAAVGHDEQAPLAINRTAEPPTMPPAATP